MKPKVNRNTTNVANDCMVYFLVHELIYILEDRHDMNFSLLPLAEAMQSIVMHDIPDEVHERIKRTKFLARIRHDFADHGLCAYTCFKHLTEL